MAEEATLTTETSTTETETSPLLKGDDIAVDENVILFGETAQVRCPLNFH